MKRTFRYKMHIIGRQFKRSIFLNRYFPRLKDKVYWSGDRHTFAKAGFIGSVCMMIPIPFQMLLGTILAYYFKANIPLASALAWITNPLTMPFIWLGGYEFGVWLLSVPDMTGLLAGIEIGSTQWFQIAFPLIWKPFLFGNITLGLIIGSVLYLSIRYVRFSRNNDRRSL